MDKEELISNLNKSYTSFTGFLESLSKDEFEYAPEKKWSAGQQAIHLIKSTKPVAKALGYPKFLISYKFGKANRASRTYLELVDRYKEKLATNTRPAPSAYAPETAKHTDLKRLVTTQKQVIEKLIEKLSKWSEEQMDQYIFPHPLLGKITVREMLYFTIYHAEHHQNLIKRYLKGVY